MDAFSPFEILSSRLKDKYFLSEVWGENRISKSFRPSAVLVPLIDRPSGVTVLLTKRTDHLYHHPGQISFPGGGFEEEDQDDPVRCALREMTEEIGLRESNVQVLGMMEPWKTVTGFLILPVVGRIEPPLQLMLDHFEVAEVLEPPLDWLMDPQHQQRRKRIDDGKSRDFWAIPWQDHMIWGATAGLLVTLSKVLRP